MFGQDVMFAGTFSKERLCLVGSMGNTGKNPVTETGPVQGKVLVAYSSADTFLILEKGKGGLPDRKLKLKAKSVAVAATIKLPEDSKKLGFSGTGFLSAVVGFSGGFSIEGTVAADFNEGVNLLPASDVNQLKLTNVFLSVKASAKGAEFKAGLRMRYVTAEGKPGTGIKASSTPLYASVGISAGSNGAALKLAGGVDMDNAGIPAGSSTPEVRNAFGQEGLTVRGLEMELTIASIPVQSEFGFHADVSLPDKWGDAIGLYPGAKIALAMKVSLSEPCLMFSVTPGPGQEYAADMAKAGVMFTRELGLVIAPLGCTIGSKKIPAGFGFAFDATFGPKSSERAQERVKLIFGVRLPSDTFNGLAIMADIDIPAWSLYDLKLDRTIIKIDIDTTQGRYFIKVKGGVSLWGSRAEVDLNLDADTKLGNFKASGKGLLKVNIGPIVQMEAKLDFNIEAKSFVVTTFQLKAEVFARILGILPLGFGVDIDYEKGVLKLFEGRVHSITAAAVRLRNAEGQWFTATDGWWTGRYTTSPAPDGTRNWRFAIGWKGKGMDPLGKALDENELQEMWVWTGTATEAPTLCENGMPGPCDLPDVLTGTKRNPLPCFDACRAADVSAVFPDMSEVNLAKVDLTGAKLQNVNLEKADLSGADLTRANLTNAKLGYTKLTSARLVSAKLIGAKVNQKTDLTKANLASANLSKSNIPEQGRKGVWATVTMNQATVCPNGHRATREGFFRNGPFGCFGATDSQRGEADSSTDSEVVAMTVNGCRIEASTECPNANLAGADLSRVDLSKANLRGANLTGANLSGAKLREAVLAGASLASANLTGTDLSAADLTGAAVKGANLSGAELALTKLVSVDLAGLDLRKWNLNSVDLSGSDLRGVNLEAVTLDRTKFDGANLSPLNGNRTVLSNAHFTEATFVGANMHLTFLNGVTFTKSDLSRATITQANIAYVEMLGGTTALGTDFTGSGGIASGGYTKATTDETTTCTNGSRGPCR